MGIPSILERQQRPAPAKLPPLKSQLLPSSTAPVQPQSTGGRALPEHLTIRQDHRNKLAAVRAVPEWMNLHHDLVAWMNSILRPSGPLQLARPTQLHRPLVLNGVGVWDNDTQPSVRVDQFEFFDRSGNLFRSVSVKHGEGVVGVSRCCKRQKR